MTVVWHVTVSLDGFITDAGGSIEPLIDPAAPADPVADAMPARVGALLAGRRSWDAAPDVRPYGEGWTGQVFVLTHEAPDSPADVTFLTGDLAEAVATAQAAAEPLDLVVTGAEVAGLCLTAGLVDELQLHVAPVILGAGTRLFENVGGVRLELLDNVMSGNIVDLRYRVLRGRESDRSSPGSHPA